MFTCTLTSSLEAKVTGAVIGRFQSILFVSVFQGLLAVAIIMIDGSNKHDR